MMFASIVFTIVDAGHNTLSAFNPATDKPHLLLAQVGLVFSVRLGDRPPPLNQSTRMEIYSFVKNNPGIQFRGLCNGLNLSVGVAQYHLGLLSKAGLLAIFKDGRYKRYFKSNKFTRREMIMISLLRHSTVKRLFSILSRNQPLWHRELASKLSISSQALTWQISRLEEKGLVHRKKVEMKTFYFLEEGDTLALKEYMGLLDGRGSRNTEEFM
jgi:predicted transcriptional regulator